MTWTDLGQNATIAAVELCTDPFSGQLTDHGRVVKGLHVWNGRVYMAYGDWNNNTPGLCEPAQVLHILGWDIAANDWFDDGNVLRSYGTEWRVVGDELWGIAVQPRDGNNPDAGRIAPDHSYSVLSDNGIGGWHMLDAIAFGGRLFIGGGGAPTTGTDAATAWYTAGAGWFQAIQHSPTASNRIYGLFVIGNTLYASSDGSPGVYKSTTGLPGSWTATGHQLGTGSKFLPVAGGVVCRSSPFIAPGGSMLLRRYTGAASPVTVISGGLVDNVLGEDGFVYVLRRMGGGVIEIHRGSSDGTSWTPVITSGVPSSAHSLAVTNDAIYVGTTDSHLWRYTDLPENLVTDSLGNPVVDSTGNYVVSE